uniref:Putative secreted protein n=1 Tax=Anopheles darlingi TaxID=43151 RepID=A0A2M4D7Z8_ANODA
MCRTSVMMLCWWLLALQLRWKHTGHKQLQRVGRLLNSIYRNSNNGIGTTKRYRQYVCHIPQLITFTRLRYISARLKY